MKSPITDKTLGLGKPYDQTRFRDIRKKAKLEEEMRYKKAKRDKAIKVPKFKIGDEIVLTSGWKSQQFHLVEIIDLDERYSKDFSYFAILKKTTDPKLVNRIGRLLTFMEGGWWRTDYCPANVENKNIRWSLVSD
jgi:hypothetical protein